ncbi:MAG: hypothetical protein ACTHLR_14115 [Rhizomicrobium sp.]
MMARPKRKILLVYAALNHPLRANTEHLIRSFREYADEHWFYLNLAHKSVPAYIDWVKFDLIIFQTTFTQRLTRSENHFGRSMKRAARLKRSGARKIVLVQDEFWNVEKVERFINEFAIDAVFSVSPESEWPKIYPNVDPGRVRFHRVLTGYIDEASLDHIAAIGSTQTRTLDICYRAAGKPNPAWGRFGYLKQKLAAAVAALAPGFKLKTDISTDGRDAKFGDDWYRFLASSRYTIGVESGTSLMDRDGTVTSCVADYLSRNPSAEFEEVEAACFPGLDGNAAITAIGPRHLEACATRTCQILVEGEYNGLLRAGIHYIPVARDLSDLPVVLASLGDEERRLRIVERAFEDIVASRKITYGDFVHRVLALSLEGAPSAGPLTGRERAILAHMTRVEAAEWNIARRLAGPAKALLRTVTRSD